MNCLVNKIQSLISTLILVFCTFVSTNVASENADLRTQQYNAYQELKKKAKAREIEIYNATKNFNNLRKKLDKENKVKIDEFRAELRLANTEIRSNNKINKINVSAKYQKEVSKMYSGEDLGLKNDDDRLAYLADIGIRKNKELFQLELDYDKQLHQAELKKLVDNNQLLTISDQQLLLNAKESGLMNKYPPIFAEPKGWELTDIEKKWNESELKKVERIYERNLTSTISAKIIKGKELRLWKIKNLKEDYQLSVEKKKALIAVGEKAMEDARKDTRKENASKRRQAINKQKEQIEAKYKKIENDNKVKRKAEKKKILTLS